METVDVQYVNVRGEPLNIWRLAEKYPEPEKPKEIETSYHKGFRVEGVPPGAYASYAAAHKRKTNHAIETKTKLPEPLKPEPEWLVTAKLKRLRPAPYQLSSAAEECTALAEKAGWKRVRITAMQKVAGATP